LFPYHAESEVELNLLVGDYIVIRKVCDLLTLSLFFFGIECILLYFIRRTLSLSLTALSYFKLFLKVTNNGWAEGECKGKSGWFPFGYVERRDRVLASKVAEVF
jgi:hypothetical protein